MDLRLYSVLQQELPEAIPLFGEDGENVPDAVVHQRQAYQWVMHLIYIYSGNLLSAAVDIVEVAELDGQDSSLNFVHSAVAAEVVVDVLAGCTIVGNGPDGFG